MNLNVIKKYEAKILEGLNDHCIMFKLIGTPTESPRWYNVYEYDKENKVLKIRSTQKPLGFDVEISEEDDELMRHGNFTDAWAWFRELRTKFLAENHPTINRY
jgi:hypothetical protein